MYIFFAPPLNHLKQPIRCYWTHHTVVAKSIYRVMFMIGFIYANPSTNIHILEMSNMVT